VTDNIAYYPLYAVAKYVYNVRFYLYFHWWNWFWLVSDNQLIVYQVRTEMGYQFIFIFLKVINETLKYTKNHILFIFFPKSFKNSIYLYHMYPSGLSSLTCWLLLEVCILFLFALPTQNVYICTFVVYVSVVCFYSQIFPSFLHILRYCIRSNIIKLLVI
jgi:hypothetical protein